MQLTGNRFTNASAVMGNDLATFPDFPSEIRAPAGTLAGVSSFQVQIADWDILTPGDAPDILIAMNPAALKSNLADLPPGGLLLINGDAFIDRNLEKAGYQSNPLEDGSLDGYRTMVAPMEELTKLAVADTGVKGRATLRSKNFFALGLVSWIFNRPTQPVIDWVNGKFGADSVVAKANVASLMAGYNFGITTEEFQHLYDIEPAKLEPGEYTNITGNQALAWGLIAGAQAANLPISYGSYPITPASSILEELARHKNFGVRTLQVEDEIAAVGVAVGASFAGHLGMTGTSGPGLALKSETISLAFQVELPMIIIDVQRAGPSTGMPTKTEQADLLLAMYGRHGEAPLPILAPATPAEAFSTAVEACRIAVNYMTPVIILSDGYIANSSEPWKLPNVDELPAIGRPFATDDGSEFLPYSRDPETLARPWAIPGTAGLEHRIGGLEHSDLTGNVSHDPLNHEHMTKLRAEKLERIAGNIEPVRVDGPESGDLLVVGWGSTFAAIRAGTRNARREGYSVAHAHLRHIHPFAPNLAALFSNYANVLVPELNSGQLAMMLRAKYLVDVIGYPKIQGLPFKAAEIRKKVIDIITGTGDSEAGR
jgi:2-oxoglutarate ferredoxin oxidoreductase subunit alpha